METVAWKILTPLKNESGKKKKNESEMNFPCCVLNLGPRLANYDYLMRLYLNHIYLSTPKNVHMTKVSEKYTLTVFGFV